MLNLLPGFDSLQAFGLLLLGFGFVIFVHELGHFLVAKAVGIKVTQFAIGFGSCFLAWRKGLGFRLGSTEPEFDRRVRAHLTPGTPNDKTRKPLNEEFSPRQIDDAARAMALGETEYRLNYLPLGGYVKMLGQEDLDPTATSADERAFNRKPVWARACVISAGVFMNLIFAVLFFIVAFMNGVGFAPAVVGSVVPGSPAAQAFAAGHKDNPEYLGLRPGDEILTINGKKALDFTDIQLAAALGHPDEPIALTIRRDGNDQPLSYSVTPRIGEHTKLLQIGIGQPVSLVLPTDAQLPEKLAAAGVKPGMRVAAVNGKPITRFDHLRDAVLAGRGRDVPVTFTDAAGQTATVPMSSVPAPTDDDGNATGLLGIVPPATIAFVSPASPAEKAGLKVGDTIASMNGIAWPGYLETPDLVRATQGKPVSITVWREGQFIDLGAITPNRQGRLGFVPAAETNRVSRLTTDMPPALAQLNLPAGSAIVAVGDRPVSNFAQLLQAVQDLGQASPSGATFTLSYQAMLKDQPVAHVNIALDAPQIARLLAGRWTMQWDDVAAFVPEQRTIQDNNPIAAAKLGILKTHQFMLQTYVTLLRLFQGTVPPSELRGVVGIADAGTSIARDRGWPYLLFFLGLISVNLVVINFLPIPIVDGGLFVFLIIEKIKGSPVNPQVLAAANWVGLVLIAGVFLMTLYFDVARLITGN